MNHAIIGTAGHVDHGKTCLIKALTGIDTDRLKEEKKRGITIELGFAYLDFADGQRVGIVDVPGHEKFVKNMLAGAGGMDIAMLVVAADEGIMPQTVEHLDILSILGIKRGVVVITKTDLVEPGSVCGVTSKEFANITGCREGIPVITAGGDQQCGAVGQGVIKKGILSVTAGTGGYLEASSEGVPENLQPDIVCNVSSVKKQYILEASVLTCCSAFDWFRREFYENADYGEINKIIASVSPGANGCLCLPCFQGRSTPDWNLSLIHI